MQNGLRGTCFIFVSTEPVVHAAVHVVKKKTAADAEYDFMHFLSGQCAPVDPDSNRWDMANAYC